MKKLVLSSLMIAFTVFAVSVSVLAAENTETLTFAWDQEDLTGVDHWNLYWSDTAGQYVGNPVVAVQYDPTMAGNAFSQTQTLTVTGEPGTIVTKYFVITAASVGNEIESNHSNEVMVQFKIPISGPFNFTVTVMIE